MYVPSLATLQSLLENETVMSEVDSELSVTYVGCIQSTHDHNTFIQTLSLQIKRSHQSRDPDVLSDYCDGSAFKSHPLFSLSTQHLQIFFYYDDIEVCNPLGSKRKIHKLGR